MCNEVILRKTAILIILTVFSLALAMMVNKQFFHLVKADDVLDKIKSSYHAIIIETPRNGSTYTNTKQIPINLTVDYIYTEGFVPWRVLSRLYYIMDNESAQILTQVDFGYTTSIPYRYSTSIDVSNLTNGLHKIEVIATFLANVGYVYVTSYNISSSPIDFSILTATPTQTSSPSPTTISEPTQSPEPQPEPFPTTLLIAISVIIAVVCIGLFVYFKKEDRLLPVYLEMFVK